MSTLDSSIETVKSLIHDLKLTKNSIVLSLGTEDGCELIELAKLGCEVHCFEPNPAFKQVLEANFKDFSNVHLNFVAAWVTDTIKPMFYKVSYQAKNGGSSLIFRQDVLQTDNVQCIDIADYIIKHISGKRIDLVLCDVEGTEYLLLWLLIDTGLIYTINTLYVEDHERKIDCCEEAKEQDDNWYTESKKYVLDFCQAHNITIHDW